ncbi:RagB/SusD family nutrient uptake outer membrane protein [Chitinophaga deserti]|uniref:RagB/SusD family nutrient uptake outer membrane protein n=1 Tax=Chitinophaga deserti TaxID=2164099 RepID=UPI001E5C9534|nr:RagB/SusD family nutrient uptake outer membrane protein [Chitinophaga deserti]
MRTNIILICSMLALASCSKWLDVSPKSEVSMDLLFTTREGYQDALNGLYSRSVKEELYGRELTAGTLDVLAQNYAIDVVDRVGFRQTQVFNYRDNNFINRQKDVWAGLYNVVANSNLILKHIDGSQNLLDADERDLIKGEALAMRAFCHFDVLRQFAPSPISAPSGKGIPYVTVFSKSTPAVYTVRQVLDSVIRDLTEARALLRQVDPIMQPGYKVGYTTPDSSTEVSGPMFLQHRRHRLNFYAVTGTLARVQLYAGNHTAALAMAKEVIESNKFPWTRQTDFLQPDDQQKDRILYKELLFGLYAPNMTNPLYDRLRNGETTLNTPPGELRTIYEVAGPGAEDFRYKQWFTQQNSSTGGYMRLEKYNRNSDKNLHDLMIPMLRLSEMYYIAAESIYDMEPARAWEYLNTLRKQRGMGVPLNDPSKTVFMSELVKDARKEFFGEGQIFYMYKRLNRAFPGLGGNTIQASPGIFVFPWPDDEIAYGNR